MEDVSILYSRESQFDGLKKLIKKDRMGREVGGAQDQEHMHTRGRFMSMYGKTTTIL